MIQLNVGGAFGLKIPTFQEEPLVAYFARKLRRPVKWIEERSENFQTGGHARDTRFYYEAAYKNDGTVTGIRLNVIADVVAPSALCGWGMSFVTWYCLPSVYKIPNSETHLRSVVTNKCPWNAYRGYGKDAASFLMDRIMDHIAKETGLDRAEIRFKNLIPPDEFPYPQVSGAMLDSGNYAEALRTVLEMADYENFPRLQEETRKEGRYIGFGIGQELIPEGCSMPGSLLLNGSDGTEVRVSPTGEVTVLTGVTSPGSGNETGIAQIVPTRSVASWRGSGWSRGTPRHARGASGTTARGASSSAARRRTSRQLRCARRCFGSLRRCSKRLPRISPPRMDGSSSEEPRTAR